MKNRTLSGITVSALLVSSLYGENSTLLSSEKQHYYEHQQNQIDAGYEKLRYEWVSPISLKGSGIYEKSASGLHDTRQSLSAGIAQDIFRSGGITYSIAYAEAKKEADTLAMHKEIAGIHQQLFNAVLTYRKNLLLLEQSEIKLNNIRIEIFLKRKQYEAGDIDITLLNNALMSQSGELKNNTSIRFSLSQQRLEAAKFSDVPIESITLPSFALTQKEDFLNEGWNVRYAEAQSRSAEGQYGQLKSSYLPKFTLVADTGLQRLNGYGASISDYSGSFYDIGLQVSMPLSYNASAAIQELQSSYLKQQSQTADFKRQLDAQYEQSLERIRSYERVIAITEDNLAFYDELIVATKAAVDSGYKAGYDLQTLKNTKKIEDLEIRINEVNVQIELANLHTMIRHSQENPL